MTAHGDLDEKLRSEVREIASETIAHRVETSDGATGWISYDSTDGTLVLAGQKGMYSGQLGIAMYFAAMYSVFEEDRYRTWSRDAVAFLLEEEMDELTSDLELGGGNGLGALVYGLSVLAELTGDQRYQTRAREFAMNLTEEDVASDEEYDILAGTAGAVVGLLGLYERTGDSEVLKKAIKCGEHLVESRYDKWGYRVWNTHWNNNVTSFSTGMGHGAAGICYALYRLYAHTHREAFLDAADDALGFENVFYSEYENNWKANWTSLPNYPLWWCYGLAGIGLARLGSLKYHDGRTLKRDVDRVRRGFEPRLTPQDSVCHGTFSQVDLLIELDRTSDHDRLKRAKQLALESIERKQKDGQYRVVPKDVESLYNPALFLGTTGIGYTILRLLEPGDIPCVLRFE